MVKLDAKQPTMKAITIQTYNCVHVLPRFILEISSAYEHVYSCGKGFIVQK